MAYPLNQTDRAALFSSSDWGFSASYRTADGSVSRTTDVLFDDSFERVDRETGAVIDVVTAVTFNRDEVDNPCRNACVEFTDDRGKYRRFLVGDMLEADEHEFTVEVREVTDE